MSDLIFSTWATSGSPWNDITSHNHRGKLVATPLIFAVSKTEDSDSHLVLFIVYIGSIIVRKSLVKKKYQ